MRVVLSRVIAVLIILSGFLYWMSYSLYTGQYQFGLYDWLFPITQTKANSLQILTIISTTSFTSLVLYRGAILLSLVLLFGEFIVSILRKKNKLPSEQP